MQQKRHHQETPRKGGKFLGSQVGTIVPTPQNSQYYSYWQLESTVQPLCDCYYIILSPIFCCSAYGKHESRLQEIKDCIHSLYVSSLLSAVILQQVEFYGRQNIFCYLQILGLKSIFCLWHLQSVQFDIYLACMDFEFENAVLIFFFYVVPN